MIESSWVERYRSNRSLGFDARTSRSIVEVPSYDVIVPTYYLKRMRPCNSCRQWLAGEIFVNRSDGAAIAASLLSVAWRALQPTPDESILDGPIMIVCYGRDADVLLVKSGTQV